MAYIADHRGSRPAVGALAERAVMSERSFQRLCSTEVGMGPGKDVERVRIDAARRLIEATDNSLDAIGRKSGLPQVTTLHRSLKRLMGVTHMGYRERFSRMRR